MRKSLHHVATVAALAAAVTIGAATAQADLMVHYSLDGGATFHSLLNAPNVAGPVGGFGFSLGGGLQVGILGASSNSPGTPTVAQLLSDSLSIKNTSDTATSIVVTVSATGFTAPTAPPNALLESHIAGSIIAGSSNPLLSFTSCVLANINADSCSGATVSTGPGMPSVTASSFADDGIAGITSLAAPYSLVQVLSMTIGAGANIGFDATTSITRASATSNDASTFITNASTPLTPAPEPLSLALLSTALIGIAAARRRSAQ